MNSLAMGIGAFMLGSWVLGGNPDNQTNNQQPDNRQVQETSPSGANQPNAVPATSSGTSTLTEQEIIQIKARAAMELQMRQRQQLQQPGPGQSGTDQLGLTPGTTPPGTSGGAGFTPSTRTPMESQPLTLSSDKANMRPADKMRQMMGPVGPNAVMPFTPTEPVRAVTLGSMGIPPAPTLSQTADMGLDPQLAASNETRGVGSAYIPQIPTQRQANAPRTTDGSASTYNTMDMQRAQTQMSQHPAFAPLQGVDKPLATAQPFSSGVSPWLNLYRNDNSGGFVNNYYTLVKPALDQRSMNQQFNVDIYGVERNNRIQQAALRQLNMSNQRALQSVGTPQFFMNYGTYYPGYGQQGQSLGQ